MPAQIEKLQAHSSHLLDAFIRLRERYSLLDPMLFDEQVSKQRGSGLQTRGFLTLRHSLFISCAQDIAKLSLDDDKRTPSIRNLMFALDDDALCKSLRKQYASWSPPIVYPDTDPEIIEALRRMDLQEAAERQIQFDDILARTRSFWTALSSSDAMTRFLTIRDKVAAHTEVQYVADKYQFVDIGALGIKWVDMRETVEKMQGLVENLGLLIRNAGFAWEMLDEQLSQASRSFWLAPE